MSQTPNHVASGWIAIDEEIWRYSWCASGIAFEPLVTASRGVAGDEGVRRTHAFCLNPFSAARLLGRLDGHLLWGEGFPPAAGRPPRPLPEWD